MENVLTREEQEVIDAAKNGARGYEQRQERQKRLIEWSAKATRCQTTLSQFLDGLDVYGGSKELDDYVYAGGDRGGALAYFHKRYMGKRNPPVTKPTCVCTHIIDENLFVEHVPSGKLFNVGKECVHRILGKIERKCSVCSTVHKNKKDNLCKDCRTKIVFINVSYFEKDEAKRMGARWNPNVKMWHVEPSNTAAIAQFGRAGEPSPPGTFRIVDAVPWTPRA